MLPPQSSISSGRTHRSRAGSSWIQRGYIASPPAEGKNGESARLYDEDVEFFGAMHADRQGELDVGRAAGSRDKGDVRRWGIGHRREEVVQRIEDPVPAHDRHVVRGKKPRLDRAAPLARAD